MKNTFFLTVMGITFSTFLLRAAPEINPFLRQIESESFVTISRLEQTPTTMLESLSKAGIKLVNPNEPFRSTDVGSGPNRRLIFIGDSPNLAFVCYEHGGMGYHLHLIVFQEKDSKLTRVFEGRMLEESKDASSVAQIKKLIQDGKIPDETAACEKYPGY